MKREPQTIGEIGLLIDAGLDAGLRAWNLLLRQMGIPPARHELIYENYEPGSPVYQLGGFLMYVTRALRGFRNIGVITDGQLCPYQDCCWMCGFDSEGWFLCPNCKRPFVTRTSDGDYEDWHTWEPDPESQLDISPTIRTRRGYPYPIAQDLGPSWGTPEGNPARREVDLDE